MRNPKWGARNTPYGSLIVQFDDGISEPRVDVVTNDELVNTRIIEKNINDFDEENAEFILEATIFKNGSFPSLFGIMIGQLISHDLGSLVEFEGDG